MKLNLKKVVSSIVLASLTVLGSASAWGATYEVDASHSNVKFSVRHLFSKVSGEFKDIKGSFDFDEKKLGTSTGEFSVPVATVNTNNEKRDTHLKAPDFFDAANHPMLTFKTKSVKGTAKKLKIEGDLTLRGVTKPVTFEGEFLGQDKDPWGGTRAGFTAKTKISRKDYGINFNKVLESGKVLVGDEVEIELNIEAVQK